MTTEDRIVLTVEEYKEFLKELIAEITRAYSTYLTVREQIQDGVAGTDRLNEAVDHHKSLLHMKEKVTQRFVDAKVIRPEAKFAMDMAESIMEDSE